MHTSGQESKSGPVSNLRIESCSVTTRRRRAVVTARSLLVEWRRLRWLYKLSCNSMLSRPSDREPTAAAPLHAHRYIFSVLAPVNSRIRCARLGKRNSLGLGKKLVLIYSYINMYITSALQDADDSNMSLLHSFDEES